MKEFPEKRFVADSKGNIEEKELTSSDRLRISKWQEEQREKWQKEFREQEARLTPEEKIERQARWEKEDRAWIAEWFQDSIKGKNEYSETLLIDADGNINREKREDGHPPFIVTPGKIKTPEDLYQLLYKIKQEHLNLDFSFEIDKDGKWIKYMVKEIGGK